LSPSARLYFEYKDHSAVRLKNLILKLSAAGALSCSFAVDKSKPIVNENSVDVVLHSYFGIADLFIGDQLPIVRHQMFLLALTQAENQLPGANPKTFEPLRDLVADFVFSSPDFYRSLNMFWDKWWRLISNPNGSFDSADTGKVSELDFAGRGDMIHSLNVFSEKGPYEFDVKSSALLLSAVQGWISLYEHPERRRWSISDIDSEYIRDLKRGRISYADFVPVRNANLERLRRLTAKIVSRKTKVQWASEFFQIIEGMETLILPKSSPSPHRLAEVSRN
jgi:hypothetical protein